MSDDPLRNGSIYRIKDYSILKSPPSIKVNNNISRISNIIDENEAKLIQDRFDLTYRSISSPSKLLFNKSIKDSHIYNDDRYISDSYSNNKLIENKLIDNNINNNLIRYNNNVNINQDGNSPVGISNYLYNNPYYNNRLETGNNLSTNLTNNEINATTTNDSDNSLQHFNPILNPTINNFNPVINPIINNNQRSNTIDDTSLSNNAINELSIPASTTNLTTRIENNVDMNDNSNNNESVLENEKIDIIKNTPSIEINTTEKIDKITSTVINDEPIKQKSDITIDNSNATINVNKSVLQKTDDMKKSRIKSTKPDSLISLFSNTQNAISTTKESVSKISLSSTQSIDNNNNKFNSKLSLIDNHANHNHSDKVKSSKVIVKTTTKVDSIKTKPSDKSISNNTTRSGRVTIPTTNYIEQISIEQKLKNYLSKQEINIDSKDTSPTISRVKPTDVIDKTIWSDAEFNALYLTYGNTPVTKPNFWFHISNELKTLGISRNEKECQDRWYLSLEETEEKRKTTNEKKQIMNMNKRTQISTKDGNVTSATSKLSDKSLKGGLNSFLDSIQSPINSGDEEIIRNTNFNSKNIINKINNNKKYIENYKKRVRIQQRNQHDSLASLAQSSTNNNNTKKRRVHKKIIDGSVTGVISPKTGKVRVIVDKSDDEEDDNTSSISDNSDY